MKPALHFIWSPLLFSMSGFMIACGIAHFAPTPIGIRPDFERLVFIAMPTAGLFIGWFIAYLATPIKMRPDTTFISDALATGDKGVKVAVAPAE